MKCGGCGRERSFNGRDRRCPACGHEGGEVTATFTSGVSAKDSLARARVSKVTTGRAGDVIVDDKPTSFNDVGAFLNRVAAGEPMDALIASPIGSKLLDQLGTHAERGLTGTYVRARAFETGRTPGRGDFGAPPSPGEGRYNSPGERSWYLARNARTARAEMRPRADKPALWFQNFAFTETELRVLKLHTRLEESAPELQYALLQSEDHAENHVGRHPYRATQFVRRLAEEVDVAAIEYPSIRGNHAADSDAVNIVVFGGIADALIARAVGNPFQEES